jgi:hypothetical protein
MVFAEKIGKIIGVVEIFWRGFLGGNALRPCKYGGYVPYKILIKKLLTFCKNFLDKDMANLV